MPTRSVNHEHQNVLEDDVTLADGWLTKEELAARRRNEHDLLTSLKPIIKQEGKSNNSKVSFNIPPEPPDLLSPSLPPESPEPQNNKKTDNTEINDTQSTSISDNIEPLRSSRRSRKQTEILNISSNNTKTYATMIKHVSGLQAVNRYTQRAALAFWMLQTLDPEGNYSDTSIPDLSLRAYKATKKGRNPDIPILTEAMEIGV